MIQEKVTGKTIDALEKLKIPYMLTGAVAVNFYGQPRLTHDLDVVLQIEKKDAKKLTQILESEFMIDETDILEAIKEKRMANALHFKSGFKIDFWILKDEKYSKVCFRRRLRKRIFNKKKAWLISPEDLVITKLVWFKKSGIDKHFEDARGILQIQKGRLNEEYLQKWAKKQKVGKLLEKLR